MCVISHRKGFTLLEVLIAVALLGILAASLYASYFAVIRARERAAEGMESRRELGATLDLLRREASSALFARSDNRMRFVVEDRDIFGKPASGIEFAALAPPDLSLRNSSGMVALRYRLEERSKKLVLTRAERDLLFDQAEWLPYPQMERISSFLVECYDGSTWVKTWDTALTGRLPEMVRFTVQVDDDGTPQQFSMVATPRMAAR